MAVAEKLLPDLLSHFAWVFGWSVFHVLVSQEILSQKSIPKWWGALLNDHIYDAPRNRLHSFSHPLCLWCSCAPCFILVGFSRPGNLYVYTLRQGYRCACVPMQVKVKGQYQLSSSGPRLSNQGLSRNLELADGQWAPRSLQPPSPQHWDCTYACLTFLYVGFGWSNLELRAYMTSTLFT